MMRKQLVGGLTSMQNFTFDGTLFCDEDDLQVKINSGRKKYKYVDGNKTDELDGFEYHCVHTESTSDFDVICESLHAPIPLDDLARGAIFSASLPMSEAVVRIAKAEFGKIRFTIRVPYITILS